MIKIIVVWKFQLIGVGEEAFARVLEEKMNGSEIDLDTTTPCSTCNPFFFFWFSFSALGID